MSQQPQTLIAHLEERAREMPDTLYSRYVFPDREPVEITFAETLEGAKRFAALFARHGLSKGDALLVILPHHECLMTAYLGAMWIGAVPAFLPSLTLKLDDDRYFRTIEQLIEYTRPKAILTLGELTEDLSNLAGRIEGGPQVIEAGDAEDEPPYGDPVPLDAEDLALIQFSSGSTGMQKGAMLSHRAVLAEIAGVGEFFELTREDSFLTWVPLYHDWGLVCVALHAIELGAPFTLLSPIHWVARPVTACEAIDRYRATVFYQPNFAFNFMTRRVLDEEMDGLDLSSVRICCNGAEPCFYDSHKMFADRFERWGFDPASLSIVYGMAEVTNSVVAAGHREPIVVDCIDREVLQGEGRAAPVAESHPRVVRMLGVGRPLRDTRVRIVGDDLQEVPERVVGELEMLSRAAYHGYFGNEEATRQADHDGWYRTGDLGYRVGDILFITGRKSDVIILGGVNIYPQDVETIVAEHPGVVAGRVAAVGVEDEEMGTQNLAVIAESRSSDKSVLADIGRFIRREVPLRLGVSVDKVHHVPYRWLIKTSSGKIARLPNYARLEREGDGLSAVGATDGR